MRTHLLRTFYPSPASERDTGSAANDADFAAHDASSHDAREPQRRAEQSNENDYVLGGYSGI